MRKKIAFKWIWQVLTIIFILVFVTLLDVMNLNYWYKAIIKLVLFLSVPLSLLVHSKIKIKDLFKTNRKYIIAAFIFGILTYGFILGGYFITRRWINYSQIPEALEKSVGITKENFIWVALYIPLVNAFIEEIFFRGFVHHVFASKVNIKGVVVISACLFSLYHIAIFNTWVNLWIVLAAIIGLLFVGILFSFIKEKTKSMMPTYLIHMFANLAINTAALFILGIL